MTSLLYGSPTLSNANIRAEQTSPLKARRGHNVYKLVVTWSDVESNRPLKAFEVEVSGDVDRALARLAHAHDMWGCEQLWLIVSDEAKSERARRLIART
ncbi:MAG: hypothetical protein ACO2OZ_11950 [Acidilobaceae archaeon]|jgi:hypothetical protein